MRVIGGQRTLYSARHRDTRGRPGHHLGTTDCIHRGPTKRLTCTKWTPRGAEGFFFHPPLLVTPGNPSIRSSGEPIGVYETISAVGRGSWAARTCPPGSQRIFGRFQLTYLLLEGVALRLTLWFFFFSFLFFSVHPPSLFLIFCYICTFHSVPSHLFLFFFFFCSYLSRAGRSEGLGR